MTPHVGRLRSALTSERGSAAAEFAVVLPAVLLVLAVCLGSVTAVAQHLRLVDAAADAARSLARGDSVPADAVTRVDPAASVTSSTVGQLACVEVSAVLHPLPVIGVPVHLQSCALGGGR